MNNATSNCQPGALRMKRRQNAKKNFDEGKKTAKEILCGGEIIQTPRLQKALLCKPKKYRFAAVWKA